MEVFIHVLKRVALVLAGYLVGLIAGLAAILVIYAVLSSLPNAPEYFGWSAQARSCCSSRRRWRWWFISSPPT